MKQTKSNYNRSCIFNTSCIFISMVVVKKDCKTQGYDRVISHVYSQQVIGIVFQNLK